MMRRNARIGRLAAVLAVGVLAPACQTTMHTGPGLVLFSPEDGRRHPPGQGRDGIEDFSALEAKLAAYRTERAQLAAAATAAADVAQCEEMFALMHSICEVKEKLCGIAEVQRGAPSYQALCEEARTECVEAQTSCEACSDPGPESELAPEGS